MKGKYVIVQVLLACLSRPAQKREDIHVLLAMTIGQRKKSWTNGSSHALELKRISTLYWQKQLQIRLSE